MDMDKYHTIEHDKNIKYKIQSGKIVVEEFSQPATRRTNIGFYSIAICVFDRIASHRFLFFSNDEKKKNSRQLQQQQQ